MTEQQFQVSMSRKTRRNAKKISIQQSKTAQKTKKNNVVTPLFSSRLHQLQRQQPSRQRQQSSQQHSQLEPPSLLQQQKWPSLQSLSRSQPDPRSEPRSEPQSKSRPELRPEHLCRPQLQHGNVITAQITKALKMEPFRANTLKDLSRISTKMLKLLSTRKSSIWENPCPPLPDIIGYTTRANVVKSLNLCVSPFPQSLLGLIVSYMQGPFEDDKFIDLYIDHDPDQLARSIFPDNFERSKHVGKYHVNHINCDMLLVTPCCHKMLCHMCYMDELLFTATCHLNMRIDTLECCVCSISRVDSDSKHDEYFNN